MGARTDAARAEVVASRQLLLDEVGRLEAAGRSAIDIPAKIRRSPGKTAALAAGTAFLALGGPKRTYRAVRRAVLGPKADLPKSMLPAQIDKALRSLGDDGDRVRGLLEREFADYLDKNKTDPRGPRPGRHDLRTRRQPPAARHRQGRQETRRRALQARRRQLRRGHGSHQRPP